MYSENGVRFVLLAVVVNQAAVQDDFSFLIGKLAQGHEKFLRRAILDLAGADLAGLFFQCGADVWQI